MTKPGWGKHTEESKQKIRDAMLGRKHSDEARKKIQKASRAMWKRIKKLQAEDDARVA